MPELPEVETIVRDLRKNRAHIICARFVDVWTDFPKMIKLPRDFEQFKKEIKNKKIKKIWRRGKNILFDLSENKTLLVHQKLTGHLLVGVWNLESGIWRSKIMIKKALSFIFLVTTAVIAAAQTPTPTPAPPTPQH